MIFCLVLLLTLFKSLAADQLYEPALIYQDGSSSIFDFPTENGHFRYLSPINETNLMHGCILTENLEYIQMDYMKMILGALFLGIFQFNVSFRFLNSFFCLHSIRTGTSFHSVYRLRRRCTSKSVESNTKESAHRSS